MNDLLAVGLDIQGHYNDLKLASLLVESIANMQVKHEEGIVARIRDSLLPLEAVEGELSQIQGEPMTLSQRKSMEEATNVIQTRFHETFSAMAVDADRVKKSASDLDAAMKSFEQYWEDFQDKFLQWVAGKQDTPFDPDSKLRGELKEMWKGTRIAIKGHHKLLVTIHKKHQPKHITALRSCDKQMSFIFDLYKTEIIPSLVKRCGLASILDKLLFGIEERVMNWHMRIAKIEKSRLKIKNDSLDEYPRVSPEVDAALKHNHLSLNFFFGDIKEDSKSIPSVSKSSLRAVHSNKPEADSELGFEEGETLTLLSKSDKNWWWAQNSLGMKGYVPSSYVIEVTESMRPKITQRKRASAAVPVPNVRNSSAGGLIPDLSVNSELPKPLSRSSSNPSSETKSVEVNSVKGRSGPSLILPQAIDIGPKSPVVEKGALTHALSIIPETPREAEPPAPYDYVPPVTVSRTSSKEKQSKAVDESLNLRRNSSKRHGRDFTAKDKRPPPINTTKDDIREQQPKEQSGRRNSSNPQSATLSANTPVVYTESKESVEKRIEYLRERRRSSREVGNVEVLETPANVAARGRRMSAGVRRISQDLSMKNAAKGIRRFSRDSAVSQPANLGVRRYSRDSSPASMGVRRYSRDSTATPDMSRRASRESILSIPPSPVLSPMTKPLDENEVRNRVAAQRQRKSISRDPDSPELSPESEAKSKKGLFKSFPKHFFKKKKEKKRLSESSEEEEAASTTGSFADEYLAIDHDIIENILENYGLVSYAEGVDPLIVDCVKYLLVRGVNEEGIFRIPGNHTRIRQLAADYKIGNTPNIMDEYDPMTVAGLLKYFFMFGDGKVITASMLTRIRSALTLPDQERLESLKKTINDPTVTPIPSRNALVLMFCMFTEIIANKEVTKLNSKNLSRVFGLSLFHDTMSVGAANAIMDFWLRNTEEIFLGEIHESVVATNSE